jgi:hypothetical protein
MNLKEYKTGIYCGSGDSCKKSHSVKYGTQVGNNILDRCPNLIKLANGNEKLVKCRSNTCLKSVTKNKSKSKCVDLKKKNGSPW